MTMVKGVVDQLRQTDWLATLAWTAGVSATLAGGLDMVSSFASAGFVDIPDQLVGGLLIAAAAVGALREYILYLQVELKEDHDGDGIPMKDDRDEQLNYVLDGLKRAVAEAKKDRDGDGIPTFRDADDAKALFFELIGYGPAETPEPSSSEESG